MPKRPDDNDRINTRLGIYMRSIRLTKGFSQEKLAGMIGVTFQQIQKYEKGKTHFTVMRLSQIVIALEIDLTEFIANSLNEIANKRNSISERREIETMSRFYLLDINEQKAIGNLVNALSKKLE